MKIIVMIISDAAVTTDHCGLKTDASNLSVRYSAIMEKIATATRMDARRLSPLYLERELKKITAAVSRPAETVRGAARLRLHPLLPVRRSISQRKMMVATTVTAIIG